MISLTDQTVTVAGQSWPILDFKVWFKTPIGLVDNIDAAITLCEERDLDPEACILAVPVAIGAGDGEYEVMV